VTPRSSRLRPFAALALGALVFAAGIALARAWLPEWRSADLPEKRFFVERYRELARRAGVRLPQDEPRVSLAGRDDDMKLDDDVLDGLGPQVAAAVGAGLLVEVKQAAAPSGGGARTKELLIRFLPSGDPLVIRLGHAAEIVRGAMEKEPPPSKAEQARFSRLLLRPGERFGPAGKGEIDQPEGVKFDEGTVAGTTYPVVGSDPPQHVSVTPVPGGALLLARRPTEAAQEDDDNGVPIAEILLALPVIAGFAAVFVLFFVLLGRRRIDLVNGLLLGSVVLAAAAVGSLVGNFSWLGALQILGAAFLALWAFLVWSTGESFLRSVHPGLTTGLDALRTGRLGPRGGSALLYGVAGGAALAGLRFAAYGLASRLPGFWADENGVQLPLFGAQTPFNHGAVLAGGVALAMGVAARFLPARWWPWAAALAGGLAVPFVSIDPSWFQALTGIAAGGILVFICLQAGLAAGLVAALSAFLLQAAAFAAMHVSWLPLSFAVSAGVPALFLAFGLVGLRRPAQAEIERVEPPAFMKRLEEERRLKYEMDLLARMQLGLLPDKLPEVEGWEIAARSLLATEAGGDLYDFLQDDEGRLWIAAGDVAGHGYSCSIAHAMTSAALASLIDGEKTPGEVLAETDRVIRRGRQRNFTSLALVRLDPRTGEAWMSNAGHPFPLLLLGAAGGVEEIDLPGLPLGQGPPRKYSDLRFDVPPGSSLVLCSDGLFEAADVREALYGYERPRDLLRSLGNRSAGEILEALFADWRRHLAGREHQDDTTVVVLKRL
jgi:sigma-B regulation protein RsbU (phosphoserine phosphatase)